MKAAIWGQAGSGLVLADLPEPSPVKGETVIRVLCCGICGTDAHLYRGELKPVPGSVPGHEISGLVEQSESFARGSLVAIEPTVACLACTACRNGTPHLCATLKTIGISAPGGCQELLAVPDRNVHLVPEGVTAEVASLAEPLAVCVRGLNMAELAVGTKALVLGSGTLGLLTLSLLRASGAGEVAVTARHPHQAELARAFGATEVFAPGSPEARAWAAANQPDVAFETVGGTANTLTEAIYGVRKGGTVVALGVFTGRPAIPAFRLVNDEVRLLGSVMYGRRQGASEFGAAVKMLAPLAAQLARLQTRMLPLDQVNEAFAAVLDKSTGTLKATIRTT